MHGGNGGNGASGGNGGNSGHSADIEIYVKPHDLDLLSLVGDMRNETVPGGAGGARGIAGTGGGGGRGGSAYRVVEYDSNGRASTRINAGGHNGASGIPGMSNLIAFSIVGN
jgi:hypothetical protein